MAAKHAAPAVGPTRATTEPAAPAEPAAAAASTAAASCIIKKIETSTFTTSGEQVREVTTMRVHGSREVSLTVTNSTSLSPWPAGEDEVD